MRNLMIVLFMATTACANDRTDNLDEKFVHQIKFKSSRISPPEFIPDMHTTAYRLQIIPIIKDIIQSSEGDVAIGLEGFPADVSESQLLPMIEALYQRSDEIAEAKMQAEVSFKRHDLITPKELKRKLDPIVKNFPPDLQGHFDHFLVYFERLFEDTYALENEPELLAPGTAFYPASRLSPKVHFFGLEQSDHWIKHVSIDAYKNLETITSMLAIFNEVLAKRSVDIQSVRKFEESISPAISEAQAWANEMVTKWPAEVNQSSQQELTDWRSRDWVKSYQDFVRDHNKGDRPFRVVIIGGALHLPSLQAAFRDAGIELRVIQVPQ